MKMMLAVMKPFLSQDAAHGAFPTLYAAVAAEAVAGGYYGPDGFAEGKGYPRAASIPKSALDGTVAKRLWLEPVSASDATPSLLPMNMLEISTRWAKGEVVQGRIMMVAGIGFTIAAILVLDRHTSLIRGFAGPAVIIVLALCGYGANLMFNRQAEINRFVVAYEADAAAFRVSERQRFLDLRTSFARNQIIWAGLSVAAAAAAFLGSSPTYVSLALGIWLEPKRSVILESID